MKVVVTGGSGKLGRRVTAELLTGAGNAPPHEVTVFDQALGADLAGARYLPGDIQDLGHVYGALAGADSVIHLAAIHTHSIAPNEVIFRTNTIGTFNVHEAAWRLGIRRVVTMSSEAVLGWAPDSWEREAVPAYLPIDEDHPLQPQDAYGLTKVACEAIARSYTAKCGMETVAIRAPWVVSEEELAALAHSNGRAPAKFGLYNYIDARDLAEVCRLSIERPLAGHNAFFVGAGESSVAEPLCSLYPRLMPAIGDKAAALTDTRSSVAIEKARALLGWTPKHSWRRRN